MRVLLIYSNRSRILEPAPPIGLSYVATAAREAGHEVQVADLMTRAEPEEYLRATLARFKPEVVGISVRNIDNIVPQRIVSQLDEVASVIALAREAGNAQIVLGGPAISILKTHALDRFDADFAVVGEGELAFPKLLAAIELGAVRGESARQAGGPPAPPWADIAGLCYREGGKILFNEAARQACFGPSRMEDWVQWPAYEAEGGTWAINSKRGCPLRCVYCNYPDVEGRELRRRSAGEIVDEIEHVKATVGPRTFEFTDATFNIPPEHAIDICNEVIRRKLKVNLSAVSMNPLGMTEELTGLMKRAGFISMVITPDAASETMLRGLRKGFTMEHVERAARLCRESGIRCTWFFLLGGPGETRETVEETISFAERHLNWGKCLTIVLTGIRLLPGTDLVRLAMEEGSVRPGQDLGVPTFYFSPKVEEQWVLDRVSRAIAVCPTLVHGAEENRSFGVRFFFAALYRLGVAPPYWRFLSLFLKIPGVAAMRSKQHGVTVSRKGIFVQAPQK
jgi:radical SAM superfamily enzyme YgiQ (UPF0313 family)